MAKVYGPLHSDDARGKLASSLVFIGWKGIKTVRQWVTPANPQSAGQGNIRTIIGGTGKAVGKVSKDSGFHTQLKDLDLIPDKQSKQSYLVQYIKDNYIAGAGATMTGNFSSVLAELTALTVLWAALKVNADTLVIADFSLTYDTIAPYDKALGLYLLAKAAIALDFTGSPYTKTLASWTATQTALMVADMTGAGA